MRRNGSELTRFRYGAFGRRLGGTMDDDNALTAAAIAVFLGIGGAVAAVAIVIVTVLMAG